MTLAAASIAETSHHASPTTPILVATDLYKRFGRTEALRGIDVAIGAGEIVAIMGPSGSGKSTLLHCLAGILTPDAGSVELAGRRIDSLGEAERSRLRRTSFGFVFQFGQLVPELTALENVACRCCSACRPVRRRGSRGDVVSRPSAWTDSRIVDPATCPVGQAQRIAVARALVTEPSVIFADEPTGSLDSLAGEQVMELLTAAARSAGTSVIVVTHEARVAAYAHREIVVRDGRSTDPVAA